MYVCTIIVFRTDAYCYIQVKHICISFKTVGRFDLDDCYICCTNCEYKYGDSFTSFINAGFWPGNIARNCQYLFSIEMFKFLNLIQKFLPGTSATGLVRTLEQLSLQHGRVGCLVLLCVLYVCVYSSSQLC